MFRVYNSLKDFLECETISLALACHQALEIAGMYSYGTKGLIQVVAPWGETLGSVEKGETFSTLQAKCIATINNR